MIAQVSDSFLFITELFVSNDLFGFSTLKQVIFCSLLMSAIDNEIHKSEWAVIQRFVSQHWKKEYGSFTDLKTELIKNLKGLLKDKAVLIKRLELILASLKSELNPTQKSVLLELIGDVMAADEKMTTEESNLYALFMEKLGLQNSIKS